MIPLVTALTLAGAGCSKAPTPVPAPVEKPIKIGFVAPLSGGAAAYGDDMRRIVEFQVEQLNKKVGRKIEVVFEDGKCAGADAASAFQKLADVDGVKYVIGGVCSSETLAMAPLAAERSVLALSPASSNPEIEGKGAFTFTLSYNDSAVAQSLATTVASQAKTVAIITEQNDYNVGVQKAFLEAMKGYPETKIVADETFPKEGTDFRSLIAKIRKANPEAILLNPNAGVTAKNLLRQLSEQKGWKVKLFSHFVYLADDSRLDVGTFAEGMVLIDTPRLTEPALVAKLAELESAKGKIKELGVYYTASTMDSMDLLASLAREFGDNTNGAREALSTREFAGNIGTITFGGKSFVQNIPTGAYVIREGKADPVEAVAE